ncbi:MAG: TolC family protein [Acidobacteriota bacterium]
MKRFVFLIPLVILLAGCSVRTAPPPVDVSREIETRTGHPIGPAAAAWTLPPTVSLADGLSQNEAVAVALWNNAAFQADLAKLGFARADLIEAGLLRNPILSLLFPIGPKQLEFTASLPLEVLWQRPHRVAAAKIDYQRVAAGLVQHGLDLARDAKTAHADVQRDQDRVTLTEQARDLRRQISELVEARFRSGDIGELETLPARADVRRLDDQTARLRQDLQVSMQRLRALLGLDAAQPELTIVPSPDPVGPAADLNTLIQEALAARPDLRAAELAIEAAGAHARWERSKLLTLAAMLDANQKGSQGFEAGPGAQIELPIFNRNQGGRWRADAAVEAAARNYVVTKQQIVLDVGEAYHLHARARESLQNWRARILPPLEDAVQISKKAYQSGAVSYLFVLETTRQVFDAQMSELEIAADLRRSGAQLARSVGKNLGP